MDSPAIPGFQALDEDEEFIERMQGFHLRGNDGLLNPEFGSPVAGNQGLSIIGEALVRFNQ